MSDGREKSFTPLEVRAVVDDDDDDDDDGIKASGLT